VRITEEGRQAIAQQPLCRGNLYALGPCPPAGPWVWLHSTHRPRSNLFLALTVPKLGTMRRTPTFLAKFGQSGYWVSFFSISGCRIVGRRTFLASL
jgi:hypothetical protein